jgi:hypothetical protein
MIRDEIAVQLFVNGASLDDAFAKADAFLERLALEDAVCAQREKDKQAKIAKTAKDLADAKAALTKAEFEAAKPGAPASAGVAVLAAKNAFLAAQAAQNDEDVKVVGSQARALFYARVALAKAEDEFVRDRREHKRQAVLKAREVVAEIVAGRSIEQPKRLAEAQANVKKREADFAAAAPADKLAAQQRLDAARKELADVESD